MGVEFPELPDWEFTAEERSAGVWQVRAVRDGGVTGEASGTDYDALLHDLKQWALRTERDLRKDT